MPIVDSTFLAGPRVQPIIRRGQGAGGEGGIDYCAVARRDLSSRRENRSAHSWISIVTPRSRDLQRSAPGGSTIPAGRDG